MICDQPYNGADHIVRGEVRAAELESNSRLCCLTYVIAGAENSSSLSERFAPIRFVRPVLRMVLSPETAYICQVRHDTSRQHMYAEGLAAVLKLDGADIDLHLADYMVNAALATATRS